MFNKHQLETTILNFISLVLDMQDILQKPYSGSFEEPEYNFYVKKYQIVQFNNRLWISWINHNDDINHIRFLKPKYKRKFLNNIYFFLHRQFLTSDRQRVHNVLTQVIFPDFCKKLNISVDFTKATSAREAADIVMCSLYWNFFSMISMDKFIEMFNLEKVLTNESIEYIKNYNPCAI